MKQFQTIIALLMIFALVGCAPADSVPEFTQSNTIGSETVISEAPEVAPSETEAARFSDRDLSGEYDAASAVSISLENTTAAVHGDGASANGTVITISKEGVYLISGTLTDGQIIIDADKSAKIQLVLNNVQISSQSSAAIYSKNADKVFVTLPEGTENTLSNGGSFAAIDENNIDSVIFSKTDLTLNGSGTLNILSAAGHGIVSKDELTIGSGIYQINAAAHGITGKDGIAIASGTLSITAGEDGIHVKNEADTTRGNLYIAAGDFDIECTGDAISATGSIQIDNGNYRLTTGGGSKAVEMKTGNDRGKWFDSPSQAANSASAKGIKANGSITLRNGRFLLDTADDAVHAGGDLLISGGSWTISTGDDGIHSDKTVTVTDGAFMITYCYEGVEGQAVTVDGGTFDIISADDGINAAGGMDGSGGMRTSKGSEHAIVINGGTIRIVSDGDSLDSNGSITLNGGQLDLICNGNGNTAVDCDGSFTNNGAALTTNDGSENGGGFGAGHGGMKGGMYGDRQRRDGSRPDRSGKEGFRRNTPDSTDSSQDSLGTGDPYSA